MNTTKVQFIFLVAFMLSTINLTAETKGIQQMAGGISFEVPQSWRKATTDTSATVLFLYIPDEHGKVTSMIKVDVGTPAEKGLRNNAEAIEKRFSGRSKEIANGAAILTETESTTVQLPRFIITTEIDEKIYFLFVASDDQAVSESATSLITKTLKIPDQTSLTNPGASPPSS